MEGQPDWRRGLFRKQVIDETWGFDSPSFRSYMGMYASGDAAGLSIR